MADLLPCPFCGGSDRVHIREQLGDVFYHVECANCDTRTTSSRSMQKAISAWNTRANPPGHAQQEQPVAVSDEMVSKLTAERDALQARIEAAPIGVMDTRDALGICAPKEEDFPALYALQGKRVALVVLG